MTFLEYVCERLMGPPANRGADRSWWVCPFHADTNPSFCTLPHKPEHKDRWRCFGCGMRGDEADLMKELMPGEDWGQRQSRLLVWRQDYEREAPIRDAATTHLTNHRSGRSRGHKQDDTRGVSLAFTNIAATYDYRDEESKLLYQVVRFYPKEFRQRKPDGNGGWEWSTKGIRRVLYRLPELLVSKPDAPVFIVEGEKDADRLASIGLVATTNAMGAGKWVADYNEPLRGRSVIVLPDNDNAGREHGQTVAKSLNGVAASVKVIELPGLPDKGDVYDWLDNGGTKAKLLALVLHRPQWKISREVIPCRK